MPGFSVVRRVHGWHPMKIAEPNEDQDYYAMDTLVEAPGITPLMFFKHERHDVGQISKAREVISGVGIRYKAKDCRKYISSPRARSSGRSCGESRKRRRNQHQAPRPRPAA